MTTGILLTNLGTPNSPSESDVRDFLSEFLSDPCVIAMPKLCRDFLVQKIILPKRSKKTAAAYQKIWTSDGSPLLKNSLLLTHALQKKCGDDFMVALGMRYKNPSMQSAIESLQHCDNIIVLPLFPQYADATTTSALKFLNELFASQLKQIFIINEFYNQHFYIKSYASLIQKYLNTDDFLLLSFHGLPKRANKSRVLPKTHPTYRAQCVETARLIAQQLNLLPECYDVAFQSRLGSTTWIQPDTHQLIKKLRQQGIENIAVVCPSFVADCVETLEEINIRLREQWMQLGGKRLTLIPCLNADETWVNELASFMRQNTKQQTTNTNA